MALTCTITVTVTEIHCASCENRIRAGLGAAKGVQDVRPDAATDTVTVLYAPDKLDESAIRTRLADLGFDPAA